MPSLFASAVLSPEASADTWSVYVPKPKTYSLSIDLNALYHLGINLYSNIPAVISEAVANSWDADAEQVWIDVDKKKRTITITDDGWGMTESEINDRYLRVGYSKRDHENVRTPKGRHVMGRKGIGKLSLFSIANIIEVHTVKTNKGKVVDRNAFVMNAKDIKKQIEQKGGPQSYKPKVLHESVIEIQKGTRLILSGLKAGAPLKTDFLRRRLARRFSIIGPEHGFEVIVEGKPITIADRDYFASIEYLWYFGEKSKHFAEAAKNAKKTFPLDAHIDTGGKQYPISGWIGTFDEQKNIDDGNNTIVVQAWGKLVQEDLLSDLDEAGLFTKYLIGEIRADFVDDDSKQDIATSDRQRLRTDDPRYRLLKDHVQHVVKTDIKLKWTDWRKERATEHALKNPIVQRWYETLKPDNQHYAREVFERIERVPVPDEGLRRELYKQSILAFESFAHRQNVSDLAKIGGGDEFQRFLSAFSSMDQLEEAYYYSIARGRMEVLSKLEEITPKSKERTIQEHIFNHLWLLDPSWERASTDASMETNVGKEWTKLDASLTKDEKKARLDIKYRTAAGKHIIIELKRSTVRIDAVELLKQVRKYQAAVKKVAAKSHPGQLPWVETVCILGSLPLPVNEAEQNEKLLRDVNARCMTYDQLIQQTRDSYREFIQANKEISRIRELIEKL
jgi:hypothetical protein